MEEGIVVWYLAPIYTFRIAKWLFIWLNQQSVPDTVWYLWSNGIEDNLLVTRKLSQNGNHAALFC